MFFNIFNKRNLKAKEGEEYSNQSEKSKNGKPYRSAAGVPIRCVHCGHDHFLQGEALLNTRGLTFFDLEWLNESAATLQCVNCGYIHWFGKNVKAQQEG